MKLSTKGRYGLRAVIDLAANSNEGHIPLTQIAKRQKISENYLEAVFSVLKRVGIVKSVKGAGGGYVLSKSTSDITIGTILRALEGDISIVEPSNNCDNLNNSINNLVWDKINQKINNYIDSVTLEQLVTNYKNKNCI